MMVFASGPEKEAADFVGYQAILRNPENFLRRF
jgi:hypothetical protein